MSGHEFRSIAKSIRSVRKHEDTVHESILNRRHYHLLQPSPIELHSEELTRLAITWASQERVALYHTVFSEDAVQFALRMGFELERKLEAGHGINMYCLVAGKQTEVKQ